MENALIPIIVTIGISTLIIVVSVIGTFVVLLNYLSARIEQSEQRMTHRMDRIEDKTAAQFEALRSELAQQRAAEQPVAGDD